MDFDEYDYLEKTVENADDRDANNSSSKSKKTRDKEKDGSAGGGSDKSHRRRDADDDAYGASDDRMSKRSRGADEENGFRRDRDKDRDRERERRHRDRDREREKERASREKDRDRERDRRDRDRDRDKDREDMDRRSRSPRSPSRSRRSRSHSARRHDGEFVSDREKELENRDSRRFRDKKETVEPEADPERDQRTVFAYQMPLKASERDVYEFFSKAGKVRDVRLIMDRNSRRSKGVGIAIMMRDGGNTLHSCFINSCCVYKLTFFSHEISDSSKESRLEPSLQFLFPCINLIFPLYIEFFDAMSVPMAIAMCGQLLLGQPVMVKPSEAEKNLVQSTASGSSTGLAGAYGATDRKLYVGNLHFNMTESHLKSIFEAFGPVELVQLPLDPETGHCKGFGFVQFTQLEHAKAAQSVNGKLEIAGRFLKISSVTDHVGAQDPGAKTADLDDDEGGLALNAQSRAMLMAKLDRTGVATSIAGSLGVPGLYRAANPQAAVLPTSVPMPVFPGSIVSPVAAEPIGTPSECLLLKNLFDASTETDPEFYEEIREDVEGECSKFGRVNHIYVDRNSAGCAYLRLDNVTAAMAAQKAMHLRWFAGRAISAIFLQPSEYDAKMKAMA
ncbi:hypothetical protein MLD38_019080 [Melastoma candidum]|uniref:Uncharacterized protein n=1 Tax=Melastoma candidum TaxID=119954 RepID=A0ACB9QV13_9MYRT|nr:hypothetical protein MLD38_019080 [Melastoma candidum]